MRPLRPLGNARLPWRLAIPGLVASAGVSAAILAGCAANEPFDPSSVPNEPPTVRLFVSPVDPEGELNPTSYYERTFRWSGTDVDGWVRTFYVSVRTKAGEPAPWDTTTSTDTTMTFLPDAQGNAEATFLLVCRDDRGALSDTFVQSIPLRNFPPTVNFQSDYDPLRNLQREFLDAGGSVTTDPAAAADTVYYNWGPMNFRMFALDLDGAPTMDSFYRYTLAEGEPELTLDHDDPAADPNLHWLRVPFNSSAEIKQFEIFVKDVIPGTRTLRVSVKDEATSDADFRYTWEVREPAGPFLFVPDGLSPNAKSFFETALAAQFGVGGWDTYNFWFGSPDDPAVFLETFRLFHAVFWTDSGSGSLNLKGASAANGPLHRYVLPLDGAPAGHMLYISKGMIQQVNGLSGTFLKEVTGVHPTPSPAQPLNLPIGKAAVHQSGTVPDMVTSRQVSQAGLGLARSTLPGAAVYEILYRMESCSCYNGRPPLDPVVGVRTPARDLAPVAGFVGLSIQLDAFDPAQASAVLGAILRDELGVVAP